MIRFYLNGDVHHVDNINPNTTVLEYLRNHVDKFDTKEGCGSGDCGACTVMVHNVVDEKDDSKSNNTRFYTTNACITLLSLMHDKHLFTASYLADNPTNNPEQAELHPAQQSMVDCHGSQCGFCTPGFIMSLTCLYENIQHEDSSIEVSDDEIVKSISGNLCRCTGYRPIIDAGKKMFELEKPSVLEGKLGIESLAIDAMATDSDFDKIEDQTATIDELNYTDSPLKPLLKNNKSQSFLPTSLENLEQTLINYPDATLWAGGTDLGLSITQQFIDHKTIVQLSAVNELKAWSCENYTLIVGAGMTYQQLEPVLEQYMPEFAEIIHRIASPQIRNMGTLGGNIANASPIGDMPPILLALDAKVHIRQRMITGDNPAEACYQDEFIPLKDFFIAYKQTKLQLCSYIVAVHIPLLKDNQQLIIHKISKRYEDDISACLVALRLDLDESSKRIIDARIGLGGMAAVPLLASTSQNILKNSPLEIASFKHAADVLAKDVTPLSDIRASREYRMLVVQRLLNQSGKQLIAKYAHT